MVVHVPKRVSVDDIRKQKGDAWTERFLTEVFGHKLTAVSLDPTMVAKTYSVLRDGARGRAGQIVPMVFRQYFFENPGARTRMLAWLKVLIDAQTVPPTNGNGNGHVKKVAKKAGRRK